MIMSLYHLVESSQCRDRLGAPLMEEQGEATVAAPARPVDGNHSRERYEHSPVSSGHGSVSLTTTKSSVQTTYYCTTYHIPTPSLPDNPSLMGMLATATDDDLTLMRSTNSIHSSRSIHQSIAVPSPLRLISQPTTTDWIETAIHHSHAIRPCSVSVSLLIPTLSRRHPQLAVDCTPPRQGVKGTELQPTDPSAWTPAASICNYCGPFGLTPNLDKICWRPR
jgi:hypothetical protein